jgi:hypothetical protein
MDFIVSKVAMSICALMVVAVLAGVFDRDAFVDGDEGLSGILERFCGLVDRAADSRSEFISGWKVPLLPSGDSIAISIQAGVVKAVSDGGIARAQQSCGLHTWVWDGAGLNLSSIVDMDESAPQLDFKSGETILIRTTQVTLENEPRFLVFASRTP